VYTVHYTPVTMHVWDNVGNKRTERRLPGNHSVLLQFMW